MRHRYERAKKHGALEALDLFDDYMRKYRLRVDDLFAFVDHDHSGSIDREEFRDALDYVSLKLDDEHFESLFQYLDISGDGLIQPTELEDAMRHHRRFKFEAPQVEKFEAKAKEMKRRGVWSAALRLHTRSSKLDRSLRSLGVVAKAGRRPREWSRTKP